MRVRARSFACSVLLAVVAAVVPAVAASAVEPPRVLVSPGTAGVLAGATRQLVANVTGVTDPTVSWSMRTPASTGSIDASGLFTAPATAPPSRLAVVRATSVEDPSVYAEAALTIASGLDGSYFGEPQRPANGTFTITQGDIDGDGVAEVVKLALLANTLQGWRLVTVKPNASGTFVEFQHGTEYLGTGTNDFVGDVELGDFDNDGDLDAFIAIEAMDSAFRSHQMYLNNGAGVLVKQAVVSSSAGRAGARASVVDWNADGQLDVVRLDRFGSVVWQRGLGNATFAPLAPLANVSGGRFLQAGDLTGDGRPDLVVGTQTDTFTVHTAITVVRNNGFGNVAGQTSHSVGLNPMPWIADVTGDGWNDVVVAVGSEGATSHPPRLIALPNLGSGTATLSTAVTLLDGMRPNSVTAGHANADDLLDLVVADHRGPGLLLRTGNATFDRRFAAGAPHSITAGDFTGDGRLDVFGAHDNESWAWVGSASEPSTFAVEPTVDRMLVGTQATFKVTARNTPVPIRVTWSATNGTFGGFAGDTYTAPSSAAAAGSPATITATLVGTSTTATHAITVVNEKWEFWSLGSSQVRQVTRDPAAATTTYVASSTGMQRSTGGASFPPLGDTTSSGTDAKQVAVVHDAATGRHDLLAVTATGLWRYDTVAAAGWTDADGGAFPGVRDIAVSGATVYVAGSDGALYVSRDHGQTWNGVLPTTANVTQVVATGETTFAVVQPSLSPRVATGVLTDPTSATLTRRATGHDGATVHDVAVDVASPTTLFLLIQDSLGVRMLRTTNSGEAWSSLPVPAQVHQFAQSPTAPGSLLAAANGAAVVYKSVDGGARWYAVPTGFPGGTAIRSLGFRGDGRAFVGTDTGVYAESVPSAPAAPTVTTGPAATTGASGSFSFSFTGSGASYRCRLDTTAWATCVSPKSYSGPLADGSRTFSVVAITDGVESPAATWAWTVDATPPPVPTIDSGPVGLVNTRTATFTFSSEGAASFECSRDGGSFSACTSGITYTNLQDGAHMFKVRALDAYGNASADRTRGWSIDATPPPYPQWTAWVGSVTKETTAYLAWTYDATATYACEIDGEPLACTNDASLSGLAEGAHTFVVRASDQIGNTVTNSVTWEVDLTAPVLTITSGPPALTRSTNATITYEGGENYYTCKLNGQATFCGWGGATLNNLGEGPYTFTVIGYDAANNASEPATHSWRVDLTPPDQPVFLSGPAGAVNTRTASFMFRSVEEDATFTCSLDGAEPTACDSGVSYSDLGDGSHSLAVRAVDVAGNPSAPATRTWSVDVTPPPFPAFTVAPAASTTSRSASFIWTYDDGATYECSLDMALVTCGNGSFDATGLADGSHTFTVVARDEAGNEAANSRTWSVDATKPVASVPTAPTTLTAPFVVSFSEDVGNVTTVNLKLMLTGTSGAHPVSLACRSVTNAAVACSRVGVRSVVVTPSRPLTPGQLYTLVVVTDGASDAAGNTTLGVTRSIRASLVEQENSLAAKQGWRRVNAAGVQGGSYVVARLRGATASYTFTGTSLTWYTVRGPSYGVADVYVDNVLKMRANLYSSRLGATYKVISGLSNAPHTVRIVVRGERGSSAGRGTDIAVDAFRAGSGAIVATPPVTMTWPRLGNRSFSGGAYSVEDTAGATFTFTFRGRGVDWVTLLGPGQGKATVTIDGVVKGTFDNYASANRFGAVRTFGGLTDKVHTMTITVLGQRRTGATGTQVIVDRFGVRP